jgi:hypothetical protein
VNIGQLAGSATEYRFAFADRPVVLQGVEFNITMVIEQGSQPGIATVAADGSGWNTHMQGVPRGTWELGLDLVADARILKITDATIISDAWIFAPGQQVITCNYNIWKGGSTVTINSDSFIEQTYPNPAVEDCARYDEGRYGYSAYGVCDVRKDSDYDIKQTYPQTLTSDAYIESAYGSLISYLAYIKQTYAATISSDAFIETSPTGTITSDAEIKATFDGSIYSNYYIKATSAGTITSDAHIREISAETISSDAWILKVAEGSINSDAQIKGTPQKTITCDANIATPGLGSINSDYHIKATYSDETLLSDARIKQSSSRTIYSDAWIRISSYGTITQNAWLLNAIPTIISTNYFIKASSTGTITQDAFIKRSPTETITCDAFILSSLDASLTSDANIVLISKGVLISPCGIRVSDTQVILRFYVPETAQGNIHIKLQIATDSGFANVEREDTTLAQDWGVWEYYNGSNWVAYPSAGLPQQPALTTEARLTLQAPSELSEGIKYWRIQGMVN